MNNHNETLGPVLHPSILPSTADTCFRDTSFFIQNASLPSPDEVRIAAGPPSRLYRPVPVVFPSLNLIVKYGATITIAEGQCLWAIRHLLPSVPVPEVYGWCRDQNETFIYMQLIEGITLADAWPDLDTEGRYQVCQQLQLIFQDLRQLKQTPNSPFIGNINQGPLRDIIFEHTTQPAGPFLCVASFNDWFSTLTARPAFPKLTGDSGPWRSGLLDDIPITFTHADLHRSNIMMSYDSNGSPRITGIIDWHQSGWYPASWEFYKTRFTCKGNEQWELDFILEFLQVYRGYISWDYFVLALGV